MVFFDKYIVKGFFGWNNFKYLILQIFYTFSNHPSKLASKRIERFVIFINAIVLLDISFFILLKKDKVTITESIAVFAAQMGYAGFQTYQIFKDKKKMEHNSISEKTKVDSETTENTTETTNETSVQ